MKKIKPFLLLIFVFVFLFLLYKLLDRDITKPNVEIIPEMVHSIAYDAFSANPNFPDGKTLQPPVKGTIARGFLPEYSEGTLTEEIAARLLLNPFKPEKSNISRGETVFRNFCQVCHGNTGMGDGPVVKKGVPPPPSLKTDKVIKMPDGQIYYIITKGKGNMASYRSQISRNDIWRVVLFIRTLVPLNKNRISPDLPKGEALEIKLDTELYPKVPGE